MPLAKRKAKPIRNDYACLLWLANLVLRRRPPPHKVLKTSPRWCLTPWEIRRDHTASFSPWNTYPPPWKRKNRTDFFLLPSRPPVFSPLRSASHYSSWQSTRRDARKAWRNGGERSCAGATTFPRFGGPALTIPAKALINFHARTPARRASFLWNHPYNSLDPLPRHTLVDLPMLKFANKISSHLKTFPQTPPHLVLFAAQAHLS